ncbi:family 78 glycoside hydrolase catalytic domain [Ureibacillus sp. GCM10028918]|uniref:family 78 glycoside hydrolase catalytic domain n=1 Tax=Ureibacillus sp. GCM10028918 TaxID=3273429 RepID=UPI003622F0B5
MKVRKSPYLLLCLMTVLTLLLTSVIPTNVPSAANIKETTEVMNLKVNYQDNPIGVESDGLNFSWMLSSNLVGLSQEAYQLVVTDSKGKKVWDSGEVKSSKSVGIKYDGPELELESRYYWKVKVTPSNGKKVESKSAYFETGTDFGNAEWIYHKETVKDSYTDNIRISLNATVVQSGFTLNWGMKNKTNGYVWSFNGTKLTQSVMKKGVAKQLGTVDLEGKISLNQAFDLEVSADSDTITTSINGAVVNSLTKTYAIEGPYIALAANPESRDTPAQKAYFKNVVLTVDGKQESVTEFDGAKLNDSGVLEFSGVTAYQKNYQGKAVKYIDDPTSMPLFRTEKKLEGKGKIASARLYMTSLGVYDAYINGKEVMVTKEDGTKLNDIFNPGWTDYYKYINYQSYDVTDYITGDSVALGVMLGTGWYGGEAGSNGGGNLYYKIGDELEKELALLSKLVITYTNGKKEVITSNTKDWKVSTEGPVQLNDLFIGEVYDARLEEKVAGWNNAGFDDSRWNGVNKLDYAGDLVASSEAAAYMLEEDRVYPKSGENTFIFDPTDIDYSNENLVLGEVKRTLVDPTGDIHLPNGKTLLINLGQNIAGVPSISVSGDEGTTVHMRGAEMLNDGRDHANSSFGSDGPKGTLYWSGLTRGRAKDQTWYTDHYTLNEKSVQDYRPSFTYHGFQYLEITASDDIVIHDVYGQPITSSVDQTLSIKTNNENVNKLFSNTLWSQKGNFLSIPTDTPGRSERLGWTGDIQVFGDTALYNFDSVAFLNNYVEILKDYAEDNNGYIADYLPTINKTTNSNAGWSDVIITLPWDIYQHTGDISVLEETYEIMKVYMNNVMANGMRAGYGDWVAMEGTAPQFMAAMYQALDASRMAKIAKLLGHTADVDRYTQESKRVIELAKEKYVDENDNLISVSADNFSRAFLINLFKDNSQTSILWALKMGMYDSEEQKQKFIDNLMVNIANENGTERVNSGENTMSTGFLGGNELLPVLTENKLSNKAYDLLLQDEMPSWLNEVKLGATTTWERWNAYTSEYGFDDYGMNSFNHYAYGSVVEWMVENMAGIEKDEENPGFKHIILQPTMDTGNQYNNQERINSVKGEFDSYYGKIISNWTSSEGELKTYEAVVPANTSATLYLPIGSASVTENIPGVTYKGSLERNGVMVAQFELQSGGYTFSVDNGVLGTKLMDGYLMDNGKKVK